MGFDFFRCNEAMVQILANGLRPAKRDCEDLKSILLT